MSPVSRLDGGRPSLAVPEPSARAAPPRQKQRAVMALALTNLPFWGVDVLASSRVPWDTLAIRGVWTLLTLWVFALLPRLPAERRGSVGWLLTGLLFPHLCLGLICWRLGGSYSPAFAWFCALPLLAVSLSMGVLRRTVVSAATSLVTTLVVLLLEGRSASFIAVWVLLIAASGLVAVQASYFYSRMKRERTDAVAHQHEAQLALAATHARAQEADRLAQVGRLAAGVAHEVNNPLAFIQANLRFVAEELARQQGGSLRECVEALNETQVGVDRIQQLVRDLTALARGAGEPGPREVGRCQLPRVIDESMRLASVRLKRLAVEVEVPPEVPAVRADARRLGQVLLNLLLNAADALEETGVVGPRVALRVHALEERVRVVLEDNGPGFAPEHLSRLFTPFFTTKAQGKGTGLGLALSREYVEAFGGSLRAENRPEGGARFTVELPVA